MNSTVSFTTTPTDPGAALGLTVFWNDTVMFDTDHLTAPQMVNVKFDDEAEGVEHTVKIVLKNKTTEHTKVDESGQIVKDAMIYISNIKMDDIEIDQIFFEKSTYRHSFNQDTDPVANPFYGNMGCNGTVEFKFSTPAYIWLLENM